MNMFKIIRCSKNDVPIRSMFNPSLPMRLQSLKGNLFQKVSFPLVISTIFEFYRQKLDTKLLENGTFQSIPNIKWWISTISNLQNFAFCQTWQVEMSLLVKIASYFGGKIQMWLKSVLENLTFKWISPLPRPIICTLSVLIEF